MIHGGRTNLSEWFKNIADKFCDEKVVEEITSVETIKKKFYIDLTE